MSARAVQQNNVAETLIGAVVNRRAELERQAVTLERQVAALALDGQGLDALIGALAAFIGRGVALEARGGASLAVVAPAGLPTSAAAASADIASSRPRDERLADRDGCMRPARTRTTPRRSPARDARRPNDVQAV